MQTADEMLVRVQREWDGWQTAEVRLADLQSIHWFQPLRAPRPLAHGYVSCAHITAGDIPHDCERTDGPHRLLVCVLKKHSTSSVYAEIARRAGEQCSLLPHNFLPSAGEETNFAMKGASERIRRLRSR
ncbi:MAG: hypothetical protein GEU82_16805 [Luteitalea sp.]|nr:hypothetical protein [Luteitalea sp.]